MLTRVLQLLRLARRRGRLNDDIEKEIAFHLAMHRSWSSRSFTLTGAPS